MSEILELSDGLRVLLAAAAGAIVGLERYIHGRAAGMRTNMLVATASALIMLLSEKYYLLMPGLDPMVIRIDPSRIAAGAITGVGFLGAGVIIKNRLSVVGLTTAATIWLISAIGLAFGAGMFALGTTGVVLALFALFLMDLIEKRIPAAAYRVFTITGANVLGNEQRYAQLFKSFGYEIKSRTYRIDKEHGRQEIGFQLRCYGEKDVKAIMNQLAEDPDILTVSKRRHLLED